MAGDGNRTNEGRRGASRRDFLRGAGVAGAGLVAGSVGTAAELGSPAGAVTATAISRAAAGVPRAPRISAGSSRIFRR